MLSLALARLFFPLFVYRALSAVVVAIVVVCCVFCMVRLLRFVVGCAVVVIGAVVWRVLIGLRCALFLPLRVVCLSVDVVVVWLLRVACCCYVMFVVCWCRRC